MMTLWSLAQILFPWWMNRDLDEQAERQGLRYVRRTVHIEFFGILSAEMVLESEKRPEE